MPAAGPNRPGTARRSGCSAYIHKPSWQQDNLCEHAHRRRRLGRLPTRPPGSPCYDTFGFGGWLQVGGTSLATPLVATIYAMAGIRAGHGLRLGDLYRDPSAPCSTW